MNFKVLLASFYVLCYVVATWWCFSRFWICCHCFAHLFYNPPCECHFVMWVGMVSFFFTGCLCLGMLSFYVYGVFAVRSEKDNFFIFLLTVSFIVSLPAILLFNEILFMIVYYFWGPF